MLNPILFTERVVQDFLRYQVTTYPFADAALNGQLRTLLNLRETRQSPLMKGPYVSLSRPFRGGAALADLVTEGLLHPHLANLAQHPHLYGHQETAVRAILGGRTTIISTGTGSGKTEAFLYPIISRCLQLRDEGAPPGIVAVLVYPMNALAEDQLERLRWLLVGSGVPFGMYVGKTPERAGSVKDTRLDQGASRATLEARWRERQRQRERDTHRGNYAVIPPEERPSREEMRAAGGQPRILLTNVKQLELLLTRQRDVDLFAGSNLEFLVFDEAHTFKGAQGAETACLIRRLRSFCGKTPEQVTCVAASATMSDPSGEDCGVRDFAERFFGVARDRVELVTEQYAEDDWDAARTIPPAPSAPVSTALQSVLDALASEDAAMIAEAVAAATGIALPADNWERSLHDHLRGNELLHMLASELRHPRPLAGLPAALEPALGRPVSEEEILLWLALGAAARLDGRPLVRPVLHVFVRGIDGAVATFPAGSDAARLWLSAEDSALAADHTTDPLFPLPVKTCKTCGQHYFTHELADIAVGGELGGGQAVEGGVFWRPLAKKDGGVRITLLDRVVSEEDPDADDDTPSRTVPIFLCRHCGTAHRAQSDTCGNCGRGTPLVPLLVIEQNQRQSHFLTSCLRCKARGGERPGTYREPARPVRAVTVSDVHVLAQNMLLHGREDRLLIFADNRQDAAFQAGWMKDHARRFRIRALMLECLRRGTVRLGDLAASLDAMLTADRALSEAVIPEVWRVYRPHSEPQKHAAERLYFLRILTLREAVTGSRQTIGLEPWGRMRVDYEGLEAGHAFFERWSGICGVSPEELCHGVAALLDNERRRMIVYHAESRLFSKFWNDGEEAVMRGYIPALKGVPKGLRLTRAGGNDEKRVSQWWSAGGTTAARSFVSRWGIPREMLQTFFEELWGFLTTDRDLLVPSELVGGGANGRRLPGTDGAHQLDAARFLLSETAGTWACTICRKQHSRPTPHMACSGWRCQGIIAPAQIDPDDYNLRLVEMQGASGTRMVKPLEHSAQVPEAEREKRELWFKDRTSHIVNTLVCTPTLELGVDIGGLDSVLLRNVPPLASNYWQRAGRAGRRHRMAVNLTYARPASHDRAFFREPMRLLGGAVEAPRLNLANPELVAKHAHATMLATLYHLSSDAGGLDASAQSAVTETVHSCFPAHVSGYLFEDNGNVRHAPRDVAALRDSLNTHAQAIFIALREVFSQGWPGSGQTLVDDESLARLITNMPDRLEAVIARLWGRLQWALQLRARLNRNQEQRGQLEEDERALQRRCDAVIERLKGTRSRNAAEGPDDSSTFAVLAAEGFLPGYGLDNGTIKGTAEMPRGLGLGDFVLPRPPAMALREFVPGNLIYANEHRFVPRYFQLPAVEPTPIVVDLERDAVSVTAGAASGDGGGFCLRTLPICDVTLPHEWHIHDEEEHRFQMPVRVLACDLGTHSGGSSHAWGPREVQLRKGMRMRLVNVGVNSLLTGDSPRPGFPVCLVSGVSRSPLSSPTEITNFMDHQEERFGRRPEYVAFHADITADTMLLRSCQSIAEAASLGEILRLAASDVLDMEPEDLQVITIPEIGANEVTAALYDPMPGGSGLLDQLVTEWPRVHASAVQLANSCASACATACIDCLLHFRNAHYHRHLDRHLALRTLQALGNNLEPRHSIPPNAGSSSAPGEAGPTNEPEQRFMEMLVRAGFPEPEAQRSIPLGHPWSHTIPDFYYADPTNRLEGICIYLDGLSRNIHGSAEQAEADRQRRLALRDRGYEVMEYPVSALSDRDRLATFLSRLARLLTSREHAERIQSEFQC